MTPIARPEDHARVQPTATQPLRAWAAAAAAAIVGGLAVLAQTWIGPAAAFAWLACAAIAGGLLARRADAARAAALDEMRVTLTGLARGDIEQRVSPTRLGDLAPTAAALNRLVDVLANTRERVGTVAGGLTELPAQVAETLAAVQESAEDQEAAVEEAASLHAGLDASIRSIDDEVASLARANEESAASILELGTSAEQISNSADSLRESLESSTAALHVLGDNIQTAAENAESVHRVAEETAASAQHMDQSLEEVGRHVQGAAELTGDVATRADEGTRAVGATIDGIEEIREVALGTRRALESLAGSVDEIGEFATVIRAISDETSLLSLNAAIIAAQAGEHGRAFAVVADQVKELARRAGSSTSEIEGRIAAVQEQSRAAVEAMADGMEAVERGVARSRAAGDALQHIRTAARDASERVNEIARASEEQGRGSKSVTEAARQTSQHTEQISQAMSDQSRSADRLLENATLAVQLCRQMAQGTAEQRSSGTYIAANSEAITERILSISRATGMHAATRSEVGATLEGLLETARKGGAHLPELVAAVETLRANGEAMREALTRFGRDARNQPDAEPR